MIQEFAIDLVYQDKDEVIFKGKTYKFFASGGGFSQFVYPTEGKGWVIWPC